MQHFLYISSKAYIIGFQTIQKNPMSGFILHHQNLIQPSNECVWCWAPLFHVIPDFGKLRIFLKHLFIIYWAWVPYIFSLLNKNIKNMNLKSPAWTSFLEHISWGWTVLEHWSWSRVPTEWGLYVLVEFWSYIWSWTCVFQSINWMAI